ncbi:hypothetical protein [Nocardia noduli]|uniref:hypothetical protein n=1 Tax=Nocardia noduli TaxID=2815722 RepID=UPI001C2275BA|nr:hypothetical protein [Nocardia noduli]
MMTARIGWVPKDGREINENEDRAGVGARRFAVADGASTTARPEIWADILVYSYVAERNDPFHPVVLAQLRAQWHHEVTQLGLPWYAERKLQEGGAATFVGLDLDEDTQRYQATAVGDTCLMHWRDTTLLVAGPLNLPDQFSNTPDLVSTHAGDHRHQAAIWHAYGDYQPGDRFVLATDALAKYLLHQQLCGFSVDLDDALDRFDDWVVDARVGDGLGNDDTTVVQVVTL